MLSDITGLTGMRIIRAIAAGEQDCKWWTQDRPPTQTKAFALRAYSAVIVHLALRR
jgi:hypothetical protein